VASSSPVTIGSGAAGGAGSPDSWGPCLQLIPAATTLAVWRACPPHNPAPQRAKHTLLPPIHSLLHCIDSQVHGLKPAPGYTHTSPPFPLLCWAWAVGLQAGRGPTGSWGPSRQLSVQENPICQRPLPCTQPPPASAALPRCCGRCAHQLRIANGPGNSECVPPPRAACEGL
jgi:hypothetical protein